MEQGQQASQGAGLARKPVGGFRFISAVQLCMAYHAYQEGQIRFLDLRAYFAAHELVARRCGLQRGQKPQYSLTELARLLGGGIGGKSRPRDVLRSARGAVRRLQRAGLLSWSEHELRFAVSPEELTFELDSFWEFLDAIPNHRRRVPVPRRTLRFLAGGARKAVVATVLGHLFRCCYYRDRQVAPEGRCKASWVAETFGVDLRAIKAARAHLVALRWLLVKDSNQRAMNRWGRGGAINLAWDRARAVENSLPPATKAPPLTAKSCTKPPPPRSNQELLSEKKNQKPASRGPTGACAGKGKGTPSLRDVQLEDLRDTGRVLEFHRQAVARGLLQDTEMGRLNCVAAAEHAAVIGTTNPPGLFATLLRKRLWAYITQEDEEAARRRLNRYREEQLGPMPEFVRSVAPARPAGLSPDAKFVRDITALLRSKGFDCDPRPLVERERPEWTRERWQHAMLELGIRPATPIAP